jgi:hypothetical protein
MKEIYALKEKITPQCIEIFQSWGKPIVQKVNEDTLLAIAPYETKEQMFDILEDFHQTMATGIELLIHK